MTTAFQLAIFSFIATSSILLISVPILFASLEPIHPRSKNEMTPPLNSISFGL